MEQALMSALDAIQWGLLLKISVAIIILGIAKRYFDNLSSCAMFRANKDLGKNVRVFINGREGFIS
jgi:hypothetical protein